MAWCRRIQTETPNTAVRVRLDAETTISDLLKMLTIKAALALAAVLLAVFVAGLAVGRSPLGTYLLGLLGK